MQRTLVDEKRWIGEHRFLHALSFCMLLPGPEAQQLAIYTGWLLNGWLGGMIAGVLFVLPGVIALLGLSWLYAVHGDTAVVTALFLGLAPAVLAIVTQAVVRIARRALRHPALVGIAVAAFLALAVFALPFPVVVLGAGVAGWALDRWRPGMLVPPTRESAADDDEPLIPDDVLHVARPSRRRNADDPGVGDSAVAGAGGRGGGVNRATQRLHRARGVLLRHGAGHLRRRLRGPGVRGAEGRRDLRMAHGGRDGQGPRPGRDDAGAADHGRAVRGVHGRLPGSRCSAPGRGGRGCLPPDHLGDVRALFHLHLPRGAVRRAAARQRSPLRRPGRDHGGSGRGHRQPGALLRRPHPVLPNADLRVGTGADPCADLVVVQLGDLA